MLFDEEEMLKNDDLKRLWMSKLGLQRSCLKVDVYAWWS